MKDNDVILEKLFKMNNSIADIVNSVEKLGECISQDDLSIDERFDYEIACKISDSLQEALSDIDYFRKPIQLVGYLRKNENGRYEL